MLGLFRKLTHSVQEEPHIVADLDALLTKPIWFKFRERAIKIPPFELQEYFQVLERIAYLDILRNEKRVKSAEELIQAYISLFRLACPDLSEAEAREMNQKQIGAVLNLINEAIMGKAQVESEKKSTEQVEGMIRA